MSGSNLIVLLLLIASLASCELFKPVQSSDRQEDREELDPIQGSRVYDPTTGEWVVVKQPPSEKMDTLRWKEIPESQYAPITGSGTYVEATRSQPTRVDEFGSEFLNQYDVTLLLPFLTDRFDVQEEAIDENAAWALNFYGGARMALQQLENEGLSLLVNVLDTEASEATVNQLLRNSEELAQSHMILGPYRRANVSAVANYAKSREVAMVSPYSASPELTSGNPYYVQVSPSLETHCAAITRHALRQFAPQQVILVSRNDQAEKERLRYFQEAHFQQVGSRSANKLQEYIVASGTSDYSDMDVMPFIQLQDTTVFIVPSWDENFVYALLRKIDLAREPYQHIVVYGMPQWMRFEYVDLDYYEKLNVHVSSNYYLDPLAPTIQFFKRQYFDKFGTVPPLEAFLGYDVMLYFGRMLRKYGTKFQYSLEREEGQYLHTRFEFERVVQPTTTGREQPPIERFENKYVNILRFRDYQFELAN